MSNLKSVSFYIRKSSPDFDLALRQVTQAKELRNALLFITRQRFFAIKGTRFAEEELLESYGISKSDLVKLSLNKYSLGRLARLLLEANGYKELPAAVAEGIGQAVSANWSSYFALVRAYSKGKIQKYPSVPGYSKRYATVPIPRIALNQKKLKYVEEVGMSIWQTRIKLPKKYQTVQSARLQAVNSSILKFTVLYQDETPSSEYSGDLVAGLDFGLENLFTVALTDRSTSFVVSGKPLKSINHRYNKAISSLQSKYSAENCARVSKGGEKRRFVETNRMRSLTDKRNRRMEAYYHSATSAVVRRLQEAEVGVLVLGYNTGMKQSSNMSKNSNHRFIPLPHKKILDELARKCEESNIEVIWTEESYTSKSSFLDGDALPVYGSKDSSVVFTGKRVTRSMYRAGNGKFIPADLNAAFNIIRKVAPGFSLEDVGDGSGVPQVERLAVP